MSGQEKMRIIAGSPREEDHHEIPCPDFTLNEESRRFEFHDRQMAMESEDPLFHNFEIPSDSPQLQPIKKEEIKELEYINFSSEVDCTSDLKAEFESIRKLQEQCRVVQQIILATSSEPIYDYKIGFESDDEGPSQIIDENCQNKELKIQEEQMERQIFKDLSMDVQQQELWKDAEQKQQQKFHVLVTTQKHPFRQIEKYPWMMDLISSIRENGITDEQKRSFLILFDKLECMRRGIVKLMAESNKNQHKCKICQEQFETGRKLGGHMSRRHPGFSYEYLVKKEIHKTKQFERSRRTYFKNQKYSKGGKGKLRI